MLIKYYIYCLLLLVITAGCHAQGARERSECKKSFLYPIVTIEDDIGVEKVNGLVRDTLIDLGLKADNTKFYLQNSDCYIQVSWSTSAKIIIVPYLMEQSEITASGFSDMFQQALRRQIENSGLRKSLEVSEEIILQD